MALISSCLVSITNEAKTLKELQYQDLASISRDLAVIMSLAFSDNVDAEKFNIVDWFLTVLTPPPNLTKEHVSVYTVYEYG